MGIVSRSFWTEDMEVGLLIEWGLSFTRLLSSRLSRVMTWDLHFISCGVVSLLSSARVKSCRVALGVAPPEQVEGEDDTR